MVRSRMENSMAREKILVWEDERQKLMTAMDCIDLCKL